MTTASPSKGADPMLSCMRAGQLAVGIGLRQARTADIGRAMATAGCDWLFIDMEHNAMGLDVATQIAVASQDAGVTPLVRVPAGDYAMACRALDGGAMGIVMPHVDNPSDALAFAQACRYPPKGRRSVASGLPQTGFANMPLAQAVESIEPRILLFPMIETCMAARQVREIAETPGIDGLLLGMTDLSMEMGLPGEVGHERLRTVVRETVQACRDQGLWAGLGGVGDPSLMREYVGWGLNFVLAGNDLGLLMTATAARIAAIVGPR